MRHQLYKLSSSAIQPLATKPRFQNGLLLGQTWPQEVNYLRDTYDDLLILWEELKEPNTDKLLVDQTEPKIKELIDGLLDIAIRVRWLPSVKRYMTNAYHDYQISKMYGRAGDYGSASIYLSYALLKIHDVLECLTRVGNAPAYKRRANTHLAYGYDISGEVFEGSGEIANRENQTNINDTAEPQDHHETPPNPANLMHDADADKEFPSLAEKKNTHVTWPPRLR